MNSQPITCECVLLANGYRRHNGVVDIYGVFSGLNLQKPGVLSHSIFMVSIWAGPRNARTPYEIRVTAPDGTVGTSGNTVEFSASERAVAFDEIPNPQFSRYGDYRFETMLDGEVVAYVILTVMPLI